MAVAVAHIGRRAQSDAHEEVSLSDENPDGFPWILNLELIRVAADSRQLRTKSYVEFVNNHACKRLTQQQASLARDARLLLRQPTDPT